jgi:hypothetical protein
MVQFVVYIEGREMLKAIERERERERRTIKCDGGNKYYRQSNVWGCACNLINFKLRALLTTLPCILTKKLRALIDDIALI